MNMTATAEIAGSVQGRLAEACRRFLAVELQDAGRVAADPQVAMGVETAEPLVIATPGCDAAQQIDRLAKAMAASVANGRTPNLDEKGENNSTSSRPQPIESEHCR